jgi:ABC-type transporter Mla subunit MlaD
METIIDILIIVALLSAAGLCIYLIMTLSKVNAVLEEAKNISQSLKPVIANIQTTSTRLAPIVDTVETLMRKLHPVIDNLAALADAAQDITKKVDSQINQILFTLNDAAQLAQNVIKLVDDIRVQIIGPVTGIAGFIGTAYKSISGMLGGGKSDSASAS